MDCLIEIYDRGSVSESSTCSEGKCVVAILMRVTLTEVVSTHSLKKCTHWYCNLACMLHLSIGPSEQLYLMPLYCTVAEPESLCSRGALSSKVTISVYISTTDLHTYSVAIVSQLTPCTASRPRTEDDRLQGPACL